MTMTQDVIFEVFLNLHNAYSALNMERCFETLVGYGIGSRIKRILCLYWEHLLMVDRAGRYCGAPLKGYQGITQGDPLYPTNFDMVVDAMIWH